MEKVFVRQEVIDGSILTPSSLACPKCDGNTLTLTGRVRVLERAVMEAGKIIDTTLLEKDGDFDVERMDCLPCQITFWVRDPKLFQLEKQNLNLQQELVELRLERGPGSGGGGRLSGLPN